jgi:CheY-like chemotaxis protein
LPARRILVVDDNRDSADSLAMLLQLAGNEVHTGHDGLQAVEMAEKFRPDVVLLDIGLPGMDGYELARMLRKSNAAIRLIALTGYGQVTDVEAAKNAGFDAHSAKPIAIAALLGLIQGFSERHAQSESRA